MTEIVAQLLSFGEIARRWGEESRKKLQCDDEDTASLNAEKWFFILLQSAVGGGFDFVQPNEEAASLKVSYFTSLRDSLTGSSVTSVDVTSRIENILAKKTIISNNNGAVLESHRFEDLSASTMREIYSTLAEELSVSREDFLRWCRVQLEDIVAQSDDMELVRPTFWGEAWDDALRERIYLASEEKRYLISEAPKFFLDTDFWEKFSSWVLRDGKRFRLSPRQANAFVDAQEKFETYVKEGKICVTGFPVPYQAGTTLEDLSAEKLVLGLMKFDFAKSEAALGVSRYVGVGTQLKNKDSLQPASRATRAGKVSAQKFMIEDYNSILSSENELKPYLRKNGKLNKKALARAIWERTKQKLPKTGGTDGWAYGSEGSVYNGFNTLLAKNIISIPPEYQLKRKTIKKENRQKPEKSQ